MVSHPFVNADLAPEEAGPAERLAASGKLGVLEGLLKKLRAAGQRALLISQEAKVGFRMTQALGVLHHPTRHVFPLANVCLKPGAVKGVCAFSLLLYACVSAVFPFWH